MNVSMLQRAEELLGANVRVEDAKKGGMLVLRVISKKGDDLVTSPPLSEPKVEAFLLGVLAGYQVHRKQLAPTEVVGP